MTPIVPRQEQFRIDYRNEDLPALFSKQASDADFSSALPQLNCERLKQVASKARLTLLIACEQLKNESLIQTIKRQADEGVRIYLLLGNSNANKTAIDVLSGRCLIRTGVSQQGTLILVDHTTTEAQEGWLLMSGEPLVSANQSAWGIQLEPHQLDDSFRSFCKLFWENSSEEYLQQNQRQSSVPHPDGTVVTNHSHQLCGTLRDCLNDTLEHLQAVTHSGFSASGDNWYLLLETQSNEIATQARTGVALTDNQIPSLLLSKEGGWLLPDQTNFAVANWCLKLSAQQSQQLEQAYDQAFKEAAWQYQDETSIRECVYQQALRFADQPSLEYVVENVREIELEDINTQDIDSFLDDDAEQLASGVTAWQRGQLAHFIDYDVVVHPPYYPDFAKPDTLYQDWEDSERDWRQRLEVLTNAQSQIDRQQASIPDQIRGFVKRFLLGQEQSAKSLNEKIDTLKKWSVTTATPAEREQYRQQLEDFQAAICKRGTDTELALDRAKQNEIWEQQHDALKADQMKKSKLLQERSSALKQLQDGNNKAIFLIEQAFKDSWIAAARKLTDQQLDSTSVDDLKPEQFMPDSLPKIPEAAPEDENTETKQANQKAIDKAKSEQKQIQQRAMQNCRDAKRQAICDMSFEQANTWKASLENKVWKKQYSSFEKCLANRDQGLKKIERDIQEAQKALDKSQAEYDRATQALDKHGSSFVYQKKQVSNAFAKQLGLNNKAAESQFTWPEEELPAAGTELRTHQQNRYLVVFATDQIDQARRDAKRLSAKIVCDRKSANA